MFHFRNKEFLRFIQIFPPTLYYSDSLRKQFLISFGIVKIVDIGTFYELIALQEVLFISSDIYNIQRVNAFHSSLKRWINKFNGVSTKYLTNYLFWYKWRQLFKTEMERNKPKKFFIHANSTYSISLIKDFKIRRQIYIYKVRYVLFYCFLMCN